MGLACSIGSKQVVGAAIGTPTYKYHIVKAFYVPSLEVYGCDTANVQHWIGRVVFRSKWHESALLVARVLRRRLERGDEEWTGMRRFRAVSALVLP